MKNNKLKHKIVLLLNFWSHCSITGNTHEPSTYAKRQLLNKQVGLVELVMNFGSSPTMAQNYYL